jgi:hypothetical protein
MEDITQLSYLSDNQLRMVVHSLEGERIDLSATWLRIHLQCGGKSFTAVHDPLGNDSKYCHVDGLALVVDIPSKRLGVGIIEYMIEVREDSQYFADGYKNTFPLEYSQTNIEIV